MNTYCLILEDTGHLKLEICLGLALKIDFPGLSAYFQLTPRVAEP